MKKDKIRNLKIYNILIGIKHYLEYIFYKMLYIFIKKDKYNIISDVETVDLIVYKKKSIARYGDGEFKWIIGMKQKNFQDDDPKLKQKLIEALTSNYDNLLIGIPSFLNSTNKFTLNAKKYWIHFLFKSYKKIKVYINKNQIYADSYITRPYLDIKDKNKKNVIKRFDNLKRIWDKRNIVIVEGEFSRLGLENDLFDNAKEIKRIICPAKNAFKKYNKIKSEMELCPKDTLFILSLGPTATVLSYELSQEGYQCIDLGHIDIEYMWFLNGTKRKIKIKGKFVNEVDNNGNIEDITNEEYNSQILKKIL